MASFRGSFMHQIDGKSRLALPKPFRRVTGVKEEGKPPYLVLTKGFNGCVAVYTEAEWESLEARLRDDRFTEQADRDFMLELADATADVPIDSVGRIVIPAGHLEMGGFSKGSEVRLVGMWDHFEIWSPERLAAHRARSAGSFEERAMGFFGRKP